MDAKAALLARLRTALQAPADDTARKSAVARKAQIRAERRHSRARTASRQGSSRNSSSPWPRNTPRRSRA